MSRPRTRSEGPLETKIVDGSEESQHISTQRRLSGELQVRLETLRFYPAWGSKGKEASVSSQQQTATTVKRPASIFLRPQSTMPLASRLNSALDIQPLREVSTRFSQHHVVPMHNSTAEDGKQGHTISLLTPHTEDIDIMDMKVAEIVEAVMPMMDTSDQSRDRNNMHNCFSPVFLFLILSCPMCALVWGNCCERFRIEIFVRVLRSSEVISLVLCK